ncbi:hypothetical protein CHUAL_008369 [Chamberlinius hualienensis]
MPCFFLIAEMRSTEFQTGCENITTQKCHQKCHLNVDCSCSGRTKCSSSVQRQPNLNDVISTSAPSDSKESSFSLSASPQQFAKFPRFTTKFMG